MRISDGSSDVGSSDLAANIPGTRVSGAGGEQAAGRGSGVDADNGRAAAATRSTTAGRRHSADITRPSVGSLLRRGGERHDETTHSRAMQGGRGRARDLHDHQRSEEHKSELQSLMRIPYTVFCTKNKHS